MRALTTQLESNGWSVCCVNRFVGKYDFEWKHVIRPGKPVIRFENERGMELLSHALVTASGRWVMCEPTMKGNA